MELDFATCYRAVRSRDTRFDGQFFTAVTSTGIYCRPICPAQTPQERNVRFFRSAAAAQAAGFRACKRCRPDTAPASPDWNLRSDLVGRALRLIADGVVEDCGVDGLAGRLAVSPRHLHREMVAAVGVGPLALARTRRNQTARLLIDQTSLPLGEIAFAADFSSIRQFNDSMRQAFGCSPSELRRVKSAAPPGVGPLVLRLQHRLPFDGASLLHFLRGRAIPGIESVSGGRYRRSMNVYGSVAILDLDLDSSPGAVQLRLSLDDVQHVGTVAEACRRLLDLDADPGSIEATLRADEILQPLVSRHPGLRVPGAVDGWEVAVRAVVGQQVSVAGARTLAGRLVARLGRPLEQPEGEITHIFPPPEVIIDADLSGLGIIGRRIETIRSLAHSVAEGTIQLDRGADREEVGERLRAISGIGQWTAGYIAMRALGDPDAFLPTDLGIRQACERLGMDARARELEARSERWRPWRAYAAMHLWQTLSED